MPRSGGNRCGAAAGAAVVLAAALVGGCSDPPGFCDALADRPGDLESVRSQGGGAVDDATWFNALTIGVVAAEPGSRVEIAAAVDTDTRGRESVLGAAAENREQVELLVGLASDPERGAREADAEATVDAVRALTDTVSEDCGG